MHMLLWETCDVSKVEKGLQLELLGIQSDSTLRVQFAEVGIPAFFTYLHKNFCTFKKFATKIMTMFGSTHFCEQLFSFMKAIKTSKRTRLTDKNLSSLIRVGAAQALLPVIQKIVNRKRCQTSGQNA